MNEPLRTTMLETTADEEQAVDMIGEQQQVDQPGESQPTLWPRIPGGVGRLNVLKTNPGQSSKPGNGNIELTYDKLDEDNVEVMISISTKITLRFIGSADRNSTMEPGEAGFTEVTRRSPRDPSYAISSSEDKRSLRLGGKRPALCCLS